MAFGVLDFDFLGFGVLGFGVLDFGNLDFRVLDSFFGLLPQQPLTQFNSQKLSKMRVGASECIFYAYYNGFFHFFLSGL